MWWSILKFFVVGVVVHHWLTTNGILYNVYFICHLMRPDDLMIIFDLVFFPIIIMTMMMIMIFKHNFHIIMVFSHPFFHNCQWQLWKTNNDDDPEKKKWSDNKQVENSMWMNVQTKDKQQENKIYIIIIIYANHN